MVDTITRTGNPYFRVHDSGDLFAGLRLGVGTHYSGLAGRALLVSHTVVATTDDGEDLAGDKNCMGTGAAGAGGRTQRDGPAVGTVFQRAGSGYPRTIGRIYGGR